MKQDNMKKIILILITILMTIACNTSEIKPMVLKYAIHYPDTTVSYEHRFMGTDNASAKVVVKTHWSSIHEKLFLWYGTDPICDETVCSSTCPLEIIGIYPEKYGTEKIQ